MIDNSRPGENNGNKGGQCGGCFNGAAYPGYPMMMPMMPGYPYGYGGAPPVITVNEKGEVVDKKAKSTMALVQKIIMMEQELAILK